MKILKRIGLTLLGLAVILQFIRPAKNIADQPSKNDIATAFQIPEDVRAIVQTSCYDCHSNTTRYPWYSEIQPVGWWLGKHVAQGKRELNFSEFAGYRLRRQYMKFEKIGDQVSEGEMPLPSYLIIHTEARLSPEAKERIISWTNAMRDTMRLRYPADSLEGGR